ncbi:hypothetical protein [Streptomyces sp. NPDC059378]|uniref:hypothetical protein n=1 Tax=Streptomyces sp. NPDC059378 TaxID=3346815 RepID=UPI0036CF7277
MNEDQLLARLRAADPALVGGTPPPDVDRLLEAAMTTTQVPAQKSGTRRPRRPLLLAAAAAVALTTAGALAWQGTRSPAASPSAAPLVLRVQAPDGAARCAAPSVDMLRTNTTAFEGAVTSVTGQQVTFRVEHWYRGGGDGRTVTVEHAENLEAVSFSTGDSYLVVAQHGRIDACGGTVWAEPQMRDLYRQAFRDQ